MNNTVLEYIKDLLWKINQNVCEILARDITIGNIIYVDKFPVVVTEIERLNEHHIIIIRYIKNMSIKDCVICYEDKVFNKLIE
jgi:hypothetical protein